ncbi:MAG: precorrin-3B C(17)-methyltransferase [Acidimicrobiales bacterium]|nr:precorrin-3B C(17)-methyltransferase [Acidimicrobiales bacterium]
MSGRVSVVGLGPGRADWCIPEVTERLHQATHLVGYRPYLAMVPPTVTGERRPSGNRVEAERATEALDLAAAGGDVVVVSSGDPGVFAMAAAVIEQLDAHPGRWDDVEVEVLPGVTAALALAARAGAPLGHDFCVISLSDVLKPWSVIERRLDAAAGADFVLALYNPRSRHRPHQLADALAIIARHRKPETVVVVGRNVGRPGESVTVTTLGELDPTQVDMSTLLLIGSTTTRTVARPGRPDLVYTPRRVLHAQRDVHDDRGAVPTGFWLLTGGARSGKSAAAEQLAARSGRPVYVIATAEPVDDDLMARIACHRAARPQSWVTIEAPLDLVGAVAQVPGDACLVLDCVTVWLGNLFHHRGEDAQGADDAAVALASALAARSGPSFVVTNEVGLGIVPDTALGRRYRDTLGRVNATLAQAAARVLFLSAGRAVELGAITELVGR